MTTQQYWPLFQCNVCGHKQTFYQGIAKGEKRAEGICDVCLVQRTWKLVSFSTGKGLSNYCNCLNCQTKDCPNAGPDSDKLDRISVLVSDGMGTDGAHHKQWYLSEILKIVDPEVYDFLVTQKVDMGMP